MRLDDLQDGPPEQVISRFTCQPGGDAEAVEGQAGI
jgi:hypothetical protein